MLLVVLSLAGCRAGAREGLPPAPPRGVVEPRPAPATVPFPAPAPAPVAETAPTPTLIEYYQISDG